jgi:capsid assembly protease
VKPTLIYAGSHKVDGNPFSALSDSARAELQGRVFAFYDRFLQTVDAGRGQKFNADAARSTEARVYMGEEAVRIGMADKIGTFASILSELQSSPRAGQSSNRRNIVMSDNQNAPVQAGITDADRNSLRAEGAKAERERIGSILRLEEASGREAQATAIALETDLNAEQAKKLLAVSPKSTPQATAPVVPPISERTAALNGFEHATKIERTDVVRSNWSKAVASANRSIGVKN